MMGDQYIEKNGKTSGVIKSNINNITTIFSDLSKNLDLHKIIEDMAEHCHQSISSGNKLVFIGNGGSAATVQHLVAEFVTGVYSIEAYSLTADSAILTALSNDYSYDDVFKRQLMSLGRRGDVLLSFSSSGNSINVINAIEYANEIGIATISFSGVIDSKMNGVSNLCAALDISAVDRVQEVQLFLGHLLFDLIVNKQNI